MGVCLGFYFALLSAMLPLKLDYYLYAFDGSLGFQPSFILGRFVASMPALFWLTLMVYNSVGFWFCVLYTAHSRVHGRFRFNIVRFFVANTCIGCALYFLFPATAPKYAYPSFPHLPPVVQPRAVLFPPRPTPTPPRHFARPLL